jgi:hypothetical protein
MTQALDTRPRDLIQSEEDLLRHLPMPDARHWLPRHKAAVVAAVRSRALSLEEASKRYKLTEEEFLSWKEAIDRNGLMGLHASQRERRRAPRQAISEPSIAALSSDTQVDCVITNISDVGARLRFLTAPSLPMVFELHCKKSGRSWWVNLVWQSDKTAGVRFNNPIPPPWTIKTGLGDWLLGKRRMVGIERIDKP